MSDSTALMIRPVERDDVPRVIDLIRDVLGEFDLTFGDGSPTDDQLYGLPEVYLDAGGQFWVAIKEDGALVGTCGVCPIDASDFELRKMYLGREARGRGVGRALLDAAVEFALSRQAKRLVLDTTEQMERAILFYEAHGFIRDDSQVRGARCTRGYSRKL